MLRSAPKVQNVPFRCCSYLDVDYPPNSLVYCDPPYAGKSGYSTGAFDSAKFWEWAQDMAANGHSVVVSEYSCPVEHAVLWRRPMKSSVRRTSNPQETQEHLFFVTGNREIPFSLY